MKLLLPAIIMTFFFCIGSVYATFNFDVSKPNEESNHINVGINTFAYFFPTTDEGLKNEGLINNLIEGLENKEGLNSYSSDLSTLIRSRSKDDYSYTVGSTEVVGSMDIWAGEDLKEFLGDNEDMTFIIYFPESESEERYVNGEYTLIFNTYYIYTTCAKLIDGETIGPVYRTTLKRNDDDTYEIVEVKAGSAPCSRNYYNYYWNGYTNMALSFDIYKWEPLSE